MKICDFYEKARQRRFDLPLLQRGFVWKPQQIEYLWDSLARRFPFGAFIVDDLNAAKVQILDGQQRATAMMLGFGCDDEIFKLQAGRLRLFIDLFNPEKMFEDEDFSRHYIFRCISRSHPWGYQLKDNNKTLQTFDIRQALSVYSVGEKKYYDDDIKRFWPYDCYLPIPVELVMQAADVATFKEKARTYIEEHFGAFVGDDFALAAACGTALRGLRPAEECVDLTGHDTAAVTGRAGGVAVAVFRSATVAAGAGNHLVYLELLVYAVCDVGKVDFDLNPQV